MRSQNVSPLSLEEHRELGKEMKTTAAHLRQLCGMVVGVYGPQNRAGFSFLKAMEALERLNQDLETQAVQDLKGYGVHGLYV